MIAPNRPLFTLRQTVVMPGAVEWLQPVAVNAARLLSRHENGDWGDLDEVDSATTRAAVTHGDRILFYDNIQATRVYIITEAAHCSAEYRFAIIHLPEISGR